MGQLEMTVLMRAFVLAHFLSIEIIQGENLMPTLRNDS
jgi:hypothetical protein